MKVTFRRLSVGFVIFVVGFVILIVAIIWHARSDVDPESVFYTALQHNLTEKGLTCVVNQTTGGITTRQTIELDLARVGRAHAVVTTSQNKASVTTEEITTPSDDYLRYTSLSPSVKTATGMQPNFSSVINVWSKDAITSESPELFSQTTLGDCIVPLADLSSAKVKPLMSQLKQNTIFKTNFSTASHGTLAGQPTLIYTVTVQPQSYVTFMKAVASAYDLNELAAISSSSVSNQAGPTLKFYISPRSSLLQQIVFVGATHSISFSGYGQEPRLTLPQASLTLQQLNQKLEAL